MTPESVQVKITHGDIAFGKPRNETWCPVGIALNRFFTAKVGSNFATIWFPNGESHSYTIPTEGRRFICLFDNGDVVHPISFTMTKLL